MAFLSSLISKRVAVTAAVEALIHELPMTADAKGIAMAIVALAFVLGQSYEDAHVRAAKVNNTPAEPTFH